MSKHVLIPTDSFVDWKRFLAQPERQWKEGYSAMTLALAWEDPGARGFPGEVEAILDSADARELQGLNLVIAIPEYKIDLPGGRRPSQTDLLALARGDRGVVAIAVEGKVDEPFGPTLDEKREKPSAGFEERLRHLRSVLELPQDLPGEIRYQLLHRTVSAVLAAEQFDATVAVMLVHSFSETNKWFDDFGRFVRCFGQTPQAGKLQALGIRKGLPLYAGWCHGTMRRPPR